MIVRFCVASQLRIQLRHHFFNVLWIYHYKVHSDHASNLHHLNLMYFVTSTFNLSNLQSLVPLISILIPKFDLKTSWMRLVLNTNSELSWTRHFEVLMIFHYDLLDLQSEVILMSTLKFVFIEKNCSWDSIEICICSFVS